MGKRDELYNLIEEVHDGVEGAKVRLYRAVDNLGIRADEAEQKVDELLRFIKHNNYRGKY